MNLPTNYQQFIHLSRYARWNEDNQRRETWNETVSRYFDFFETHLKENHNLSKSQFDETRKYLEKAVLYLNIMPSMRAMMTAGEAAQPETDGLETERRSAEDRTMEL